jgi:hypothetical protein
LRWCCRGEVGAADDQVLDHRIEGGDVQAVAVAGLDAQSRFHGA